MDKWKYITYAYLHRVGVAQSVQSLDYRLDYQASIPRKDKEFFLSLCVQTGAEAHLASYPKGTSDPYLGVNSDRGVTLTTGPLLVSRSRTSSGTALRNLHVQSFSPR